MAQPKIPQKAKLFIGMLTARDDTLFTTIHLLKKKYGAIDLQSEAIPFSSTEYYSTIGKNLYKVFISFEKLIPRDNIAGIKLYTTKVENKFIKNDNRTINIDPGYLTLSNVFLASCKDFFHRVYVGKGIYVENEYRYVAKRYQPWEWTYPDYRKKEYIQFFETLRSIYHEQLKKIDRIA